MGGIHDSGGGNFNLLFWVLRGGGPFRETFSTEARDENLRHPIADVGDTRPNVPGLHGGGGWFDRTVGVSVSGMDDYLRSRPAGLFRQSEMIYFSSKP